MHDDDKLMIEPLELLKSWKQWCGTPDPAFVDRLEDMFDFAIPDRIVYFDKHVEEMQSRLLTWTRRFVPDDIADDFEYINAIELSPKIKEMIRYVRTPDNGVVNACLRCEATRAAVMAAFEGQYQGARSRYAHKKRLKTLMEAFEPRSIVGSRHVHISMRHNPEDHYAVSDIAIDLPLTGHPNNVYSQNIKCRILRNGQTAIYKVDVKDQFETYLKMLERAVDGHENPLIVKDRARILFVLTDDASLMEALPIVREDMMEVGGDCSEPTGNLNTVGVAMTPSNKKSSPKFRAMKFLVKWQKATIEVQFMTLKDYYSAKYAVDERNHWIYKYPSAQKLLPILYPFHAYEVDFAQHHERQLRYMREQLLTKIKSRLRQH